MVEMSCEEHDRIAASTQFITHTVGRILGSMDLAPTPIDTRGFQSLLNLVDNTTHDSFDLYYGLFMYNAVSPSHCLISLFCSSQPLATDVFFIRKACLGMPGLHRLSSHRVGSCKQQCPNVPRGCMQTML